MLPSRGRYDSTDKTSFRSAFFLFLIVFAATASDTNAIQLGDPDGFRAVEKIKVTDGVECQLLIVNRQILQGGWTTIIQPIFEGSYILSAPMEVIVNMTDQRYTPWAQKLKFKEIKLEVLDSKFGWLKPEGVMQGPDNFLPGGALHIHIRVSPRSKNDTFRFVFVTYTRAKSIRLVVGI